MKSVLVLSGLYKFGLVVVVGVLVKLVSLFFVICNVESNMVLFIIMIDIVVLVMLFMWMVLLLGFVLFVVLLIIMWFDIFWLIYWFMKWFIGFGFKLCKKMGLWWCRILIFIILFCMLMLMSRLIWLLEKLGNLIKLLFLNV